MKRKGMYLVGTIITAAIVLSVCASFIVSKLDHQENVVYAAAQGTSLIDYTVVVKDDSGNVLGNFLTVSNIGSITEVIEYQDGEDRILRKRPGRTLYPNVTLERALSTGSDAMWTWRQTITMGKPERHTLTIEVYSKKNLTTPAVRYILNYCWPNKVVVPEISSNGKEIAIEQWEIACEGMSRQ